MEIVLHELADTKAIELVPNGIEISKVQDMLDLMMEASQSDAGAAIIHESSLLPAFFELRTGLAGEIAQKVVNYRFRIFVLGEFDKYASKSLRDYIRESNEGKAVNFFASKEMTLAALTN